MRPGSTLRDSAGRCSRFVPSLRTAYKRHLAARGNTQHVRRDPAYGDPHERPARPARAWGVELSP